MSDMKRAPKRASIYFAVCHISGIYPVNGRFARQKRSSAPGQLLTPKLTSSAWTSTAKLLTLARRISEA
jgi:hypothetical protein